MTLAALVDYVVDRPFQRRRQRQDDQPAAVTLLEGVCEHFARLVAHWQVLGFVHGVLNTDNALLCGTNHRLWSLRLHGSLRSQGLLSVLSTDRGAMPGPTSRASCTGTWRYSLSACCPYINEDAEAAQQVAQEIVDRYPARFHTHHQRWLAAKLGLDAVTEADGALIQSFHELLATEGLDLTAGIQVAHRIGQRLARPHAPPRSFDRPARIAELGRRLANPTQKQ
jgi:uncharacterized protein YdiU (UPF0061 family)